jgi:hypothetical protein
MQLPDSILGKLHEAARQPRTLRGWQLSLRTLFVLTAACGVVAFFHEPIWAWAQGVWELWFPSARYDPNQCGPCGMG